MRAFALFALLLPSPALADQILASSTITAVTVYPQGAEITREVVFTGPAGAHDLLVTDLARDTVPEMIRVQAPEGVGLGAFALRTDRLPPRDALTSPELAAAKVEVEAWEAKLQAAMAAVEAIEAKMQAAYAQAEFLGNVKAEGGAMTPETIKTLAGMIGAEVLAAKQAALAAKAELPAAQKVLEEAREALDKARAAEAAVLTGAENYAALSVAVTLPAAGAQRLTVTHFIYDATWQPVYELWLTRSDNPTLTLNRGVLVSQSSGEDWRGVALTLSTAQPSAQSAPSAVWPELRRIVAPKDEAGFARMSAAGDTMAEPMAEAVVAAAPMTAQAGMQGDTVVYHYPAAVDVAAGVENLRLALDTQQMAAKVVALAVPRHDRTAFVQASFTNESPEPLLPGDAYLMREGVMVGSTMLELLAPGAKVDVAFGAIEGLRLKREMPLRTEGDRGIISTSTQIEEKAVLEVENLTQEVWPVRLVDGVPYSEQEDLEISFEAVPEPATIDVDGQRGVMAWEFDIAPGETKAVSLSHVMSWPEGMELR